MKKRSIVTFIVIVFIVAGGLGIMLSINYIFDNDNAMNTNVSSKTTTTTTTTTKKKDLKEIINDSYSEEEYKNITLKIAYKDLARNPKDHENKNIYFKGKVIQVMEDSSSNIVCLRVNTKLSNYKYIKNDYTDDTLYVILVDYDENNRILEDDIIEVWGVSSGIYTYETVAGSELSIPSMIGIYYNIKS